MDNKADFSDDDETSFLSRVLGVVTAPVSALISKGAQKAYLGTFLLLVASTVLSIVAVIGYCIFYSNYVPQIGLERVVHLQFGDEAPWGTAPLGSGLVPQQKYDVSVSLCLPRTPANIDAGNFMLDLAMLSSTDSTGKPAASEAVIASSRRPATLTYASPLVDTARRVMRIPLYLVGLQREEENLEVQMMEDIEFPRGWRKVPNKLKLEIHSREQMQVYGVRVKFAARFTGIRWLMYTWRISAFLIFTSMFWSAGMVLVSITWLLASTFVSSRDRDEDANIKTEEGEDEGALEKEEDASELEEPETIRDKRTRTPIKDEEIEETTNIAPLSAGYNDYDGNSGLGTGLDRQTVQWRRSHLPTPDDD